MGGEASRRRRRAYFLEYTIWACCASSSDTIESRAVLSDTLSPRRQRASPGMASGPKLRRRAGGVVSGERRRRVRVRRSVLALARDEAHEVLGEG